MATAAPPKLQGAAQRFEIHDISWEGYQALLKVLQDRPIGLTYDRGTLELVTTVPMHERYRSRFVRMIEILADELDLDYFSFGSMTIPSRILECGLEPDACFHIASADKVGDWKQFDPESGPPPDLAVEIDVTSDSRRRLRIYAALQVAEVWRFDGENLSVLILRDGAYEPSETSASFPVAPMDAIAAFVRDYETGTDKTWSRAFRRWVRETVVPRMPGDQGGETT
jgi:Uma2 family endonuclease